jgi:hypothetical protein
MERALEGRCSGKSSASDGKCYQGGIFETKEEGTPMLMHLLFVKKQQDDVIEKPSQSAHRLTNNLW